MDILQFITTLLTAILASSGLWAYLAKKDNKTTARDNMLIGIGHELIQDRCIYYINRGYITPEEYADLDHYLYTPYKDLGGNGSAARDMEKVRGLPSELKGGDRDDDDVK